MLMKYLSFSVLPLTLGLLAMFGWAWIMSLKINCLPLGVCEGTQTSRPQILVCLRITWGACLKMPTHGEFDFESVGWWASLASLLRRCWYRRLPELETVKLYLKGNDVHKAEATSVDCKADAVLFFLYRKKKKQQQHCLGLRLCLPVNTHTHVCVSMQPRKPQSHTVLFSKRERLREWLLPRGELKWFPLQTLALQPRRSLMMNTNDTGTILGPGAQTHSMFHVINRPTASNSQFLN